MDPFEAQQAAEAEIQQKMDSLAADRKDYEEPPGPPKTKKAPKRSPKRKRAESYKEEISVKAMEAQAKELDDEGEAQQAGYTHRWR